MYEIQRCESKETRALVRDFTELLHSYIRFADRPSRKLYWLLLEYGNVVGAFGLSSAFVRPKCVATYMEANDLAFNEMGHNHLFCLSYHRGRNAGSKLLSLCRRDAKSWWRERYGDDLKAMQTFVLPPRTGAVYKADNWERIGTTVGRTTEIRTVRPSEAPGLKNVEERLFESGEIRHLVRTRVNTEPKLVFARKV